MKNKFFKIPLMILMGIGAIIAVGFLVMFLWNELITFIFHAPYITFWQALGLLVLARILFGGFKHHDHRKRVFRHQDYWHKKFEEKLNAMSQEEFEKYVEMRKKHFEAHC